jgi:hypothetical protein
MQLEVTNTQAHHSVVLVNPNNVQHTDAVTTNENNELAIPNTHRGILNTFF